MRWTGKTIFIWQVIREQIKQSIVREALLCFNFEDERLAGLEAANLHWAVEEYYRLNPGWRDRKRAVFFFDEIQAVPGWELFVRGAEITYIKTPEGFEVDFLVRYHGGREASSEMPDKIRVYRAADWLLS
jgi:hypothetical protein